MTTFCHGTLSRHRRATQRPTGVLGQKIDSNPSLSVVIGGFLCASHLAFPLSCFSCISWFPHKALLRGKIKPNQTQSDLIRPKFFILPIFLVVPASPPPMGGMPTEELQLRAVRCKQTARICRKTAIFCAKSHQIAPIRGLEKKIADPRL